MVLLNINQCSGRDHWIRSQTLSSTIIHYSRDIRAKHHGPWQLPSPAGAAGDREALDAHNAAREADQNRGEDDPPCPVRGFPTGEGGYPARTVSVNPVSYPPVRRNLPEARTDMTGWGEGQPNARLSTSAIGMGRPHSNGPIEHSGRHSYRRSVGSQAVAVPQTLGFLPGGVIVVPKERGGVAGSSSYGKCQLRKIK